MSGCGRADGTSHGKMAVGSGAGYFRRRMKAGFGHVKSQVPVERV